MMLFIRRSLFALALMAALFLPPPASALDISLDGFLRGNCGTATASSNAATLNNKCGVVTSESLTTAAGSVYTLTLTNSAIAAADVVLWSVGNGTNTLGAIRPRTVAPAAGSAVFLVQNDLNGSGGGNPASLSGTIQVRYFVIKP